MKDFFSTKDSSIFCNYDCDIILNKNNIEELPNGDLEAFMFGSLVVIHSNGTLEPHVITLATKVIIPIYSSEQISSDEEHVTISFISGDKLISNVKTPAILDNVYQLYSDVLAGRLSNLIPYYLYYDIILICMKLNTQLNFPRVLLEITLSELALAKGSSKPARLNAKTDPWVSASTDDLVQLKGTFNSMTFEDSSKSILINKGKTKAQQTANPSLLEKYMRK